uniref:Uncharacterized protein n=1 Tax=Oryza sativa subsp. japonica TaxID=39947 RepID=Q651N6_ORYSJ|nr:hypothetical protein [Oryza sativa Japonica Group]
MVHGSREVGLPAAPASDAREEEGIVSSGRWPEEEVAGERRADAAELGRATAAPMRRGAAGGGSARAWLCGGAGPGAGRGRGGAAGVVVIPPSCGHRIQFKLYALDDEVIKGKLMDAIEGHVLGEAQLMAVF